MRQYPIEGKISSAPATGRYLYYHIMRNLKIPASCNHNIWYAGEEAKLKQPEKFPFRGDIPKGKTLELITLGGEKIPSEGLEKTSNGVLYTFNGKEDCVLVSDLTGKSRDELKIIPQARDRDKVFNSNFKPYDELNIFTKYSNELAALSVPKSISNYLSGKKNVNYTERDVFEFLEKSLKDLSSNEMMFILNGNNQQWSALAYMRSNGNVEGDLMTEFHGQNPDDFYSKDLGTVLPAIYFTLAMLGEDPLKYHNMLDTEVWGARDAAKYMRKFLPETKQVQLEPVAENVIN